MDIKADEAQKLFEQMRRDKEDILERIANYHQHIDRCTAEISEYLYIMIIFVCAWVGE